MDRLLGVAGMIISDYGSFPGVAGMISDYGSFPHSLGLAPVSLALFWIRHIHGSIGILHILHHRKTYYWDILRLEMDYIETRMNGKITLFLGDSDPDFSLGNPHFSAVSVMNCSHKSPSTPRWVFPWKMVDFSIGKWWFSIGKYGKTIGKWKIP